jgi:hypothetical protein
LANRYSLTPEKMADMLLAQGGVCAICKTVSKKWVVDHDHQTKMVRAILCDPCNRGLGNFQDCAETVQAAAEYLCQYVQKIEVA